MPRGRKRKRSGNGGPRKRRRTTRPRRNIRTGGFLGIEMKFADTETDTDAFATTWAPMEDGTNNSVSGVAIGNGESQRIGRKYSIHSVHLKFRVFVVAQESQNNPIPDLFGRVCLVLDTQTNGAQLTASEVFDEGQTENELAFRNLQHTKRFRVLMDKKFYLRVDNINEGAANLFAINEQSSPLFNFNKRFSKPINVICDGTDALIASISDNSLHVIGVANSSLALLDMQVRIRYTG